MFCQHCGKEVNDKAVVCVHCGCPLSAPSKSRALYVVLALFFGCLGVHNFYAGYNGRAVVQLLITILGGILIVPIIAVGIWVLIEICIVNKDARGVPFN